MPTAPYTLEAAEADIAALRGQITVLQEAHTFTDVTDPPTNPAAGLTTYSLTGDLKYASSDGGDYATGRASIVITANQTISSSSDTVIGANSVPMSWTVGAGTYLISGMVNWSQNASTNTVQSFGLTGPAISSYRLSTNQVGATGGGITVNMRETSGAALASGVSPGFPAGTVAEYHFTGAFTTTAGGTVSVVANAPVPANTFVIGANSFATLWPVI